MYIPPAFRQTDVETQRALIAAHPLAQLINLGEQGLQADPLPLLLDSYPDGAWRLRGHLARANPHGKSLARDGACLVIFQGRPAIFLPAGTRPRRSTAKSCRPGITKRCIATARRR
ncbi:hypothetical protein SODG_000343 [Sodalis praecaptivus]